MTNDEEILDIYRRNHEEGFRKLMKEYGESVYRNIRRMVVVHEDAEDVAQETFVRIFSSLEKFRGQSSLRTWIFRIATNEALRFLAKPKEQAISEEEVQEDLISKLQASEYIDYEDAIAVKFQEAILRLPRKQQMVFNLRYYDELDYQAISQITGDVVSTLKVNYHLAKEKIKEYMTKNS